MSTYLYPDSKVIDEITIQKTPKGGVRAYLHARDGADMEAIRGVLDTLKCHDMECVPFAFDAKPYLEIRGFKKGEELIQLLSSGEWVAGSYQVREEAEDKITWREWFEKHTLQLSGAAYLVGDYGFAKYNLKEADRFGVAGAASYFFGTLALLFYGRNDQSDLQVHDLAKELEGHIAKEKIGIPKGSAMHEIAKDKPKTTWQRLDEFCKRYPSEIFNSVTALAGVFVGISAYKKVLRSRTLADIKAMREMMHEGYMDVGLGAVTATSGIAATVIKEKKHDPDALPKAGLAWVWEKIREHPLAVAGGGYTIATLFHAGSTYKAWREAKRVNDHTRLASVPGRALFVGMALLSEFLLAISSKGHGEGVVSDSSVDNSVIAIAAELIVRQPADQQDKLIGQIGRFLGQQEELAMEDSLVIRTLRRQVEAMRNNPWAKAYEKGAAAPDAPPEDVLTVPSSQVKSVVWQTKMAVREASTDDAQLAV